MHGCAFQTGAALPVMALEGQMRDFKTASARRAPSAMHGCAFQTGVALPVMVLEGQMRDFKKEDGRE